MRTRSTVLVATAIAALAIRPGVARAHALLDPQRLQAELVEIARIQERAKAAPPEIEALYDLGERVESMLDLLNQDVAEHGAPDVLARLVVERLRTYGVQVHLVETQRRYTYDLAAFREYLAQAPDGPRAPGAWFRVLARSFHERTGPDPARLATADAAQVVRAAAGEQQFLDRYPADVHEREVRFFLGVDHYRLAKAGPASQRARHRRLGRDALRMVVARHPGTMEARAAEMLLEELTKR